MSFTKLVTQFNHIDLIVLIIKVNGFYDELRRVVSNIRPRVNLYEQMGHVICLNLLT